MLAEHLINNDEELLIAGCGNGMEFDAAKFNQYRTEADVLVFTYRNNESVLENPNAYGWMRVDDNNNITEISIKKAISENPMNDHAVVATFWFKHGSIFVEATRKMIEENDRINNEFNDGYYPVKSIIINEYKLGEIIYEIDRKINTKNSV